MKQMSKNAKQPIKQEQYLYEPEHTVTESPEKVSKRPK